MNFIDHTNHCKKQTFSAAVIVDNKGKQCGKIVIRFTNSLIGYNHEIGVIFYPAELNFSDTSKGSVNSNPDTLFTHLQAYGIKAFSYGKELINYHTEEKPEINQRYDSLSNFNEITAIKYKRKSYNVLWAM